MLVLVGGLSTAMLLWMSRPLLTGQVPLTGDLLHFYYPMRDFYSRALAAGQSFDWMPSLFSGFYLTGEGQLGSYHPLHLLLYRLLPLDTAFGIELVAAYPFLLAGTWLFLRRWCGDAAAAFGAMLFAFSGFSLSHGVHPNMISVAAHIPWLLWAIDQAFTANPGGARRRAAGMIGVLTGSQLLLGYPQAVWLSLLIEASYASVRLLGPGTPRRQIGTVAAGKLLGVAVGGVQILATLHAFGTSTRAAADDAFATSFALPPLQLLQLLNPYALWGRIGRWNEAAGAGDEFAAYGGAVTLAVAVWWLALRRSTRRAPADDADSRPELRRLAAWAGILAMGGAWMALGSRGGLYLLQTWLPVVGRFRAPVRYVLLTQLGLALLAALGCAALLRPAGSEPEWRRAVWAPWAVAGLSAISALWLAWSLPGANAASAAIWVGPLLFAAAAALLTLYTRGARWAVVALVVLAAGDHALYGLGGIVAWQDLVTRPEAEGLLDTRDAGGDLVVPAAPARIAHGGFPDLYLLSGYRALDGYLGLTPSRLLDYRVPQALRVAQAGYAHAEFQERARVPGAEPLPRGWYRLPAPLPRVRLVGRARTSSNPAADIARIDVETEALVDADVALDGGAAGTATLAVDDPGRIHVRIRAPGVQLLVVSESYDDGWRADVGGRDADVRRTNGDFIGVVVPAGEHDVALTFQPAHLAAGRVISLVALILALALVATSYRSTSSNR